MSKSLAGHRRFEAMSKKIAELKATVSDFKKYNKKYAGIIAREQRKERKRLTEALNAMTQAIVDLSVHPAGCEDWEWYETLCLEVADRLDTAIVRFHRSNKAKV